MKPYLSSTQDVLKSIDSTSSGLSTQEAKTRLERDGANKLAEGKKKSLIRKFFEELADPMTLILLAAALISGITAYFANESFADVFIILAVVLINAVLGIVQENKAENAIAALQEIAAATSKVLRDGKQLAIRSEELVVGDVVVLEAGDAVPADARILECASMKVEEAALTGESVPVDKQVSALSGDEVPLGDRKNMVYMGSTVVYGRGLAVITATGMATEMGKIAGALADAKDEQTPLQKKLGQLSKILSFLVIGICAVIFAVDLIRAYPNITGEGMLDTFLVAVSLAVAAIPEGLAAVVTIVLSVGVTNMSKRNAVIRRLTAVETLGCTQVICSDKTGTLTQNKMTVIDHSADDISMLALGMRLCCDAKPDENGNAIGEPTECALVNDALSLSVEDKARRFTRIGEAPFDSGRKMMSVVCREGESIIQFTKGAPDEVLRRCTHCVKEGKVIPLTDAIRKEILSVNKSFADQALRVLCCAMRQWSDEPSSYEASDLEKELCYLGLSAMIDPIRPEVKDAIVECRNAGIRPVMITGDHKDTAVAIANQLGILEGGYAAITGAELDRISEEDFDVTKYAVYARVQPEHKVRIVNAWKKAGYITAMTGDGVNDAPSIKSADIGVGMGITGTDVTKNVADMVLSDDNFATIVSAVEEGRRIYDNIRKAIQYLLSSNLAEVLAIFVATMLGFTILEPVHLLWINLITDCFPALALGMEKSERDIMRRKPRSATDGIFAGGLGIDAAVQGILVTILTLSAYFIGHFMESGIWEVANSHDGITMAFLTLSLVEIFHAFNMRSRRGSIFTMSTQNKWLWAAAALSLICTIAVVWVPFLSEIFRFERISLAEFGVSVVLAALIIPLMEIAKFIQRKLGK